MIPPNERRLPTPAAARSDAGTVATTAIHVLLLDNQVLFRQGIKVALQTETAVRVVGEAGTVSEALDKTGVLQPNLVMMEILLPGGDGIGAIRTIRERWPRIQVLVLTSCVDDERFRKAAAAGAIGYILKDIEPVNLAHAIRATYSGRTMLSPTIAGLLVNHYFLTSAQSGDDGPAATDGKTKLIQREIDVLTGVVQGLSDKRIAANLFVSAASVKTRLRAVYQKLGVRNRAHAAVYAVENGLIDGAWRRDLDGPFDRRERVIEGGEQTTRSTIGSGVAPGDS